MEPNNHSMSRVGEEQSLFPTALPCPVDAAIHFKKQIHVFRGCKLWSEKGELTHLHKIGLPCNVDAAFVQNDRRKNQL